MFPALQASHSLPWILTQVAASRGVSDSQQLQDSIQHFFTHDLSAAPGLLCTPPPTTPLHPALLHHVPDSDWQNCVSSQHTATLISPENLVVCNSTNLGAYSTSGRSGGSVFCGVLGTGGIGGIHQVKNPGEVQLSEEFVLPDLSCPPPSHGNRNNFCVGVPTRMVSSHSVQPAVTVTRGDKNNNSSSSSYNTQSSCKTGSNSHYSSNNSSNNNHKNKGTDTKRPPEPDIGTDRSEGEQLSQPILKYDVEVRLPVGPGEEARQSRQKQPLPSQAVNAKEVEKLLQDALWKGTQNEEKSDDAAEAASSGGCDTGYSSRCSTPPGTLSVPPDSLSDTSNTKQGTNTWEQRSHSPSSYSTTSQGSYRNPRPKRRHNSNGSTSNSYSSSSSSSSSSTADHQEFHKNYHQQYHHPSHQIRPIHNNQFHQYHHQNHHHSQVSGGGFGGNQYYSHHYPNNFVVRDCSTYQNRRYERNYSNYGHYNNHYGRDYSYHNIGGELPHYGRYNQGRGYHNRYHSNHQNNGYTQRNEATWDRSGPLEDRAGTFSCELKGDPRWKCEVVDAPSHLLNGSEWDGLSQQVWDFFKQHQQTNKTFNQKMKLKDKVLKAIRNVHWVQAVIPNCRLYVVGSSLSGFGADWSDVDMCLMVAGRDLDQRTEATAILRILQRELHNCSFIEKMELIRAKVPILKFRDSQTQVDVDLNCNNAVGIRNTHLLNSYSQLDWRVRPLVLVVKLWAQHHNINNAKNMTISSYSLVLMVIHYLQKGVEPPVLPCLQKLFPEKFRSHGPVTNIIVTEKMPTFTSKNTLSLGQLFHGFLDHFANKFKFTLHPTSFGQESATDSISHVQNWFIEETISVRTGGTVPTAHCRSVPSSKNDSRMWKYLCIEEPFDLTNTARSVYDEEVFKRVRRVFMDSYNLLEETRDLSSILGETKL